MAFLLPDAVACQNGSHQMPHNGTAGRRPYLAWLVSPPKVAGRDDHELPVVQLH
jgi:hypothetical protein